MSIPKAHVDFCRDIAALAQKYGLEKASVTFRPAFDDDWKSSITMNWEQGRHGEDSHRLRLSSTVDVFANLDGKKAQP